MYNEYPDLIYEGLMYDLNNLEISTESFNLKEKLSSFFKKIKNFLIKIKDKFIEKVKALKNWLVNIPHNLKDKAVDWLLQQMQIRGKYYNTNTTMNFFSSDINRLMEIDTYIEEYKKLLDAILQSFSKGENPLDASSENNIGEKYSANIEKFKDFFNEFKYLSGDDSTRYFVGFNNVLRDRQGKVIEEDNNVMIITKKVFDLDKKIIEYISKYNFDEKINKIIKSFNEMESMFNTEFTKYQDNKEFNHAVKTIINGLKFITNRSTTILSKTLSIISKISSICKSHIELVKEHTFSKRLTPEGYKKHKSKGVE